ncbi:MAG: M14 family zinc carboxypeptidase, partial [Ignavibacterium sp.]
AFGFGVAQQTPLEKSNYTQLTSYEELSEFISEVDKFSDLINAEVIGTSTEGRNLYAVKFSKTDFGKDESKIKVLIFAQQHGNEQSGKEAALLLINELQKPENLYLFDKIDFALIPQMNPDGSEKNQRRNGNEMDLNRNHLILTEPETIALHKFFNKYLFEVTMDVHEYWPFGEEWKKLGFRRNFDVTVGAITNINISQRIRDISYQKYLPFIFSFIGERGYSAFHYLPGGPVGVDYLRYSTFDINDGRQSFGIQNTLSFIQEGMNGENYSTDNIEHRAKGQMTGMLGLLKFCYDNKDEIKEIISEERQNLIENKVDDKVAIQLDHFNNGSKLELKLLSYYSNKDTILTVDDFRPVVKSTYSVKRPKGYLIPKKLTELKEWMDNHNLFYTDARLESCDKVEEYFIDSIGIIDFERDTIINPYVSVNEVTDKINLSEYYLIPVNQLKNNMIVIALEPKSMLGLVTYKQFEHLLKQSKEFPIFRVIE